jgi:hypothetical protein
MFELKIVSDEHCSTGDSALNHASNESNSEIAHYAIPLFLDSNVGCSSRHHVSIISLMEEQFDCKK